MRKSSTATTWRSCRNNDRRKAIGQGLGLQAARLAEPRDLTGMVPAVMGVHPERFAERDFALMFGVVIGPLKIPIGHCPQQDRPAGVQRLQQPQRELEIR